MENKAVLVKYHDGHGGEVTILGFIDDDGDDGDEVLRVTPFESANWEPNAYAILKSAITYRVTFDASELRRISDFVWCEPGNHETPAETAVCIDDEDTWACPECAAKASQETAE